MFDMQIFSIFSAPLFRKLLNNYSFNMIEFNALLGMLVTNNIPFDTSFVSGTRKSPQSIQLTIHINPTTTLVFVVSLEPGSSVFSPSP